MAATYDTCVKKTNCLTHTLCTTTAQSIRLAPDRGVNQTENKMQAAKNEPHDHARVVSVENAEVDDLKPDPDLPTETRKPTGNTEIDWSGFSYEDDGRLYQGYMPGGW